MGGREAVIKGHKLVTWPNQVRWTGTKNVLGDLRSGGCECGVDFSIDSADPYGEHVVHLWEVASTLARRRWTEFFTKQPVGGDTTDGG